jgi:hypothetical protein
MTGSDFYNPIASGMPTRQIHLRSSGGLRFVS